MFFHAPIGPSTIETITAWGTLTAAVATGISAFFIAWQIALTRKSVQTTEKTLEVARNEFERGRALQIESQRARIDSEMPRLTITLTSQTSNAWLPDFHVPSDWDPTVAQVKEIKSGHTFLRKSDLDQRVQIGLGLRIANDGPRRAVVLAGAAYAGTENVQREIEIGVGENADFWAVRVHTVREWLDLHERRHKGEITDVQIAEIVYIFPGDVGAIERHYVVQGGCIVEPSPDEDWSVRFIGFDSLPGSHAVLRAVVQPFTREYFASRLASGRLN